MRFPARIDDKRRPRRKPHTFHGSLGILVRPPLFFRGAVLLFRYGRQHYDGGSPLYIFFFIQLPFIERKRLPHGVRQGHKLRGRIAGVLPEAPVERADILETAGERDIDNFPVGIAQHVRGMFDPHCIQIGNEIDADYFGKKLRKMVFAQF